MEAETATDRWKRLRRVVEKEPLPLALVDLDAVDENVRRLVEPVRATRKTLRLASKSIRAPALVRYIADRAGAVARGLMTYTAAESALLADHGFDDLLLAYPTARLDEARLVAETHAKLSPKGGRCAVVVDDDAQLDVLAKAARDAGTRVPLVIELDVAYRAFGAHVGVRRSPLSSADAVVALASRIAESDALTFLGLMGYEAQIAGVPDAARLRRFQNVAIRLMKRMSTVDVARTRATVVRALSARGLTPALVNGGGTGSLRSSIEEDVLTEVTAGSGFLDSHLFDGYRGLSLVPAAYFALQVVRRPLPNVVTCHGGGWIASGEAGVDRLPVPSLPPGLRLLAREGAGEVQTPVVVPEGIALALGEPIFFRHAKAGELAEHVNELLLVRGDRIEARVPTYRGLGRCFLG